ncbi:DUF5993 family protein [Burkholderia dolosa]|uniref:Uncharacterized protein n=2 Tax=Burkholderiaceae TaxID=119060 RepID=A0A892IER9_9BURK|nr:DUF5993 family protein [Burkholderia dolosa]AJY11492.1 hypothetical protein AK34_5151 [Burkholderia dolosa AU0158]ETP61760.1 hypothetical protein BDSB_28865 [Burkholderia dolosa PC543]QRO81212.1 hypothetical protein I6K02_25950 [Burkholderia dolosa]UAK66900.1 DUF5993 family protein [Burkholderia dolosa]UEC11836.1 DUF5993 family protein [Burkholderia dolosa]
MFMFLPFLLSLMTLAEIVRGKYRRRAILFLLVTLAITVASFSHHVTDSLNLSF